MKMNRRNFLAKLAALVSGLALDPRGLFKKEIVTNQVCAVNQIAGFEGVRYVFAAKRWDRSACRYRIDVQ